MVWPRFDSYDDLRDLGARFLNPLAQREDTCICIRHDPDYDGPIEDAIAAIDGTLAKELGDETQLEIVVVNDPIPPGKEETLRAELTACVIRKGDPAAHSSFLEQTGAPIVRTPEALVLAIESSCG
ncbi:MAG: hypothetical protein V3T14_06005 [Myxococcota bacterium]